MIRHKFIISFFIFLNILKENFIQSQYPLNYQLGDTAFIRKQTQVLTYSGVSFQDRGPFYINNFISSTSRKLRPFYTITQFHTYTISSNQIYFFIKIENPIINITLNRTQYTIRINFLSSITSIKIPILFFHQRCQNYFYSGWIQFGTPMTFPLPPSSSTYLQPHDLAVEYATPGFILPGNYSHYMIDILVLVSIRMRYLDNCVKKLPQIGSSLNNNTHYSISFAFNITGCTLPPQITYIKLAYILYNPNYLANTQYTIKTIIRNCGTMSSGSATSSTVTLHNPYIQNLLILGFTTLIPEGNFFQFDSAAPIASDFLSIAFWAGPASTTMFQLKALIIQFKFVYCPLVYDEIVHQCVVICTTPRSYTKNTSLSSFTTVYMYSNVRCSRCFYTCKTCNNDLTCLTCDIADNRVFNPSTLGCDPMLGYYDNGFSNSTVAFLCNFTCKGCYLSPSYCTACDDGFKLINNTCIASGCISSHNLNYNHVCLACDPSLFYVYYNFTCICDTGFTQIYIPNQLNRCQNICGDGLKVTNQQCDDGNDLQNDGCYQCLQQTNWYCTQASLTSASNCTLYVNFYLFKFNYAYKTQGKNQGYFSYTIEPVHRGLTRMNWKNLLKLNISSSSSTSFLASQNYKYDISTGQLRVQFQYLKQLQDVTMQTNLTFDPKMIVSNPSFYSFSSKINGLNAPLTFDDEITLKIYYASSIITIIIMVLILLQFYIASYYHKMIGLQTINVLQIFYFTKMIVSQKSTILLNSLNYLKLSTSGYSSTQIYEIDTFSGVYSHDKFLSVDQKFLKIWLQKYFLFNINIFLIPLIIALIVYLIYFSRKYYYRTKYIKTNEQYSKDKYTILKRSTQWIYDHFVFPYTLMFNMISFFNLILYLNSFFNKEEMTDSDKQTNIYRLMEELSSNKMVVLSICCQLFFAFLIFSIYCYEIFYSQDLYISENLTQAQKQKRCSLIQKLQHDDNSPDRPNYHSLYVFTYMVYIFFIQLAMVISVLIKGMMNVDFGLQGVMGIAVTYFIILIIYKPYHKTVNKHNNLLIFNQVTIALFISLCYIFQKTNKLSSNTYVILISLMLFLLSLVCFFGYMRIFIQRAFRKWLQENSSALKNNQQFDQNTKHLTKKQALLMNNQYLFINQLKRLKKQRLGNKKINNKIDDEQLQEHQENFFIEMIKAEYKKQQEKRLYEENMKKLQNQFFNYDTRYKTKRNMKQNLIDAKQLQQLQQKNKMDIQTNQNIQDSQNMNSQKQKNIAQEQLHPHEYAKTSRNNKKSSQYYEQLYSIKNKMKMNSNLAFNFRLEQESSEKDI